MATPALENIHISSKDDNVTANDSNEPITKKQRQSDKSPKTSTSTTESSPSSASNTNNTTSNSTSESLAQLAQSVIEEMDMKRKNDEAMISEFRKMMEMQTDTMCNTLQQSFGKLYQSSNETCQEKLQKLYNILGRIRLARNVILISLSLTVDLTPFKILKTSLNPSTFEIWYVTSPWSRYLYSSLVSYPPRLSIPTLMKTMPAARTWLTRNERECLDFTTFIGTCNGTVVGDTDTAMHCMIDCRENFTVTMIFRTILKITRKKRVMKTNYREI
eukprot:TCONS_00026523-protein